MREAPHASHADERRENEKVIRAIKPNTSGSMTASYDVRRELDGVVETAVFRKRRTSGERSRTAAYARLRAASRR